MIENVVLHTRLIEKLFPSLFVQLYQIEMKSIDIWVRVENYIWKPMLRVSATKKFEFHKKDIAANSSQSFSVLPNFSSIFLMLKGFQFSLRAVCNFLTFFLSMPHSGIACTIWRYYISFFGLSKYFHASMFCTIFSSATFLFWIFHFDRKLFSFHPIHASNRFRIHQFEAKSNKRMVLNMQFCLRFPINLFSNRKSLVSNF